MEKFCRFALVPLMFSAQLTAFGDANESSDYVEMQQDLSVVEMIQNFDTQFLASNQMYGGYQDNQAPSMRAMHMDVLVSEQGGVYVRAEAMPAVRQRNYSVGVTDNEAADIRYIVKTLGNSNIAKIGVSQPSLKSAGDRIDRVHPLNFLTVVFSDEELKASMRNLEGKSWVWKKFLKGLTDSLAEESATNNILPFANDFANRIGINPSIFMNTMQAGQWEKFVIALIHGVPRKGQTDRYDM